MIWLTFVKADESVRLPFLRNEELPVFNSDGSQRMAQVREIMPGAVVAGRGVVVWCDYITTPDEKPVSTDPDCGFLEQVRFDNPMR